MKKWPNEELSDIDIDVDSNYDLDPTEGVEGSIEGRGVLLAYRPIQRLYSLSKNPVAKRRPILWLNNPKLLHVTLRNEREILLSPTTRTYIYHVCIIFKLFMK